MASLYAGFHQNKATTGSIPYNTILGWLDEYIGLENLKVFYNPNRILLTKILHARINAVQEGLSAPVVLVIPPISKIIQEYISKEILKKEEKPELLSPTPGIPSNPRLDLYAGAMTVKTIAADFTSTAEEKNLNGGSNDICAADFEKARMASLQYGRSQSFFLCPNSSHAESKSEPLKDIISLKQEILRLATNCKWKIHFSNYTGMGVVSISFDKIKTEIT